MNLLFNRSGGQTSKINVSAGLHSIWKLHRKICLLALLEASHLPSLAYEPFLTPLQLLGSIVTSATDSDPPASLL